MFPSPKVLNAQEITILTLRSWNGSVWSYCGTLFLNWLFHHLVLIIISSFCSVGEHQEFSQCLLAWPPEG